MMTVVSVYAQAGAFDSRIISASKTQQQGLTLAKGVQKAAVVPIVTDEVIDEAPAGTVVSGSVRSGFSYYYVSGNFYGGYNGAFSGEYVLGDDENIYLKDPCASVNLGTYLKLEKIDDENYVAHTAQLVYVDTSGDTPYLVFATRLVFHQYSETSFGYIVEEDAEGNALTDIYFTYKDGVLQQKDQETVEMNGIVYPRELIAFTNSTGGWIGYGDGCLTIKPVTETSIELPAEAEVKDGSLTYFNMSSTTGQNIRQGKATKYAEVGDDFYLLCPADGKNWIKGSIDRQANTVSFKKQYVGIDEDIDCHIWMIPATYNTWRDVWDEEEDYGEWVRDYTATDALVCKYDNGDLVYDSTQPQAMTFSRSKDQFELNATFADITLKPYVDRLVTPATPTILKFEPVEVSMFWGELIFAVPPVDVNDVYINTEDLSYVVYFNNETTPYTFKTDDHMELNADMTEIPFSFVDDMDFNNKNLAFHNIYFYEPNVEYAGVQTIHRKDGQEQRSEIGWYNHTPSTGISDVNAIHTDIKGKWMENGRIIIIKDGKKFNVQGQKLN